MNEESELTAGEVWCTTGDSIVVNHFYNPCKGLSLEYLEGIIQIRDMKVVLCGDLNAHNIYPMGQWIH